MEISISTPLKECIDVLKDTQWHNIYEFHQKYHLSAAEIYLVLNFLLKKSLIEKNGYAVRFVSNLNNSQIALLNSMQKTRRPAILDLYEPSHLTKRRKRV